MSLQGPTACAIFPRWPLRNNWKDWSNTGNGFILPLKWYCSLQRNSLPLPAQGEDMNEWKDVEESHHTPASKGKWRWPHIHLYPCLPPPQFSNSPLLPSPLLTMECCPVWKKKMFTAFTGRRENSLFLIMHSYSYQNPYVCVCVHPHILSIKMEFSSIIQQW